MQNIMIEFLEHTPQFKRVEYRVICLKWAHKAYLNKQKIQIIEYETDSNQPIHMIFENIFLEHEIQHNEPQRALF